ncbi:hypothetical protein D3C72_1403770 [compost metagenome]
MLVLGAEAHHMFHTGPVVPTAIEKGELAGRRQLGRIAAEVPGASVTVGWLPQCDDARFTRTEVFDNALDGPILPRRIPSLKNHQNPVAAGNEVLL